MDCAQSMGLEVWRTEFGCDPMALGDEGVVVGLTHFPGEVAVGLGGVIAGEHLVFRIPLQGFSRAQRDGAEVADGCGPMPDFGSADRVLAGAHALEEISHVIVALIEALCVFGQGCGEEGAVVGLDFVAVYPDPSVAADKADAVALAGGIDRTAKRVVIGGGADLENDAVWIGEFHLVFAESGEASGDECGERRAFDMDRRG